MQPTQWLGANWTTSRPGCLEPPGAELGCDLRGCRSHVGALTAGSLCSFCHALQSLEVFGGGAVDVDAGRRGGQSRER